MRIEMTDSTAAEFAEGGHRDVKKGDQFEVAGINEDPETGKGKVTFESAQSLAAAGRAKFLPPSPKADRNVGAPDVAKAKE
jgi:hypothetical protein